MCAAAFKEATVVFDGQKDEPGNGKKSAHEACLEMEKNVKRNVKSK